MTPPFDTHKFVQKLVDAGLPQEQAEAQLDAMIGALTPLSAKAFNKLDSTDYENIYLQVRNRGWKWLVAVAAVLGSATILTAYTTVRETASKSVDHYVNSKPFKAQVLATAVSRLDTIEDRMKHAERDIALAGKQAAALSNLPVTVTAHGLTIVDKSGTNFYIETGTSTSGVKVMFQSPFRDRPAFFIQEHGHVLTNDEGPTSLREYRALLAQERREYGINGRPELYSFLTDPRTGVRVRSERPQRSYDWVAIGR